MKAARRGADEPKSPVSSTGTPCRGVDVAARLRMLEVFVSRTSLTPTTGGVVEPLMTVTAKVESSCHAPE